MHLFKQITNPFFINVWIDIMEDRFIGLVIFSNRLSDAIYLNFLVNILSQFLAERLLIYMMLWCSGTLVHFGRNVREHLNTMFDQR